MREVDNKETLDLIIKNIESYSPSFVEFLDNNEFRVNFLGRIMYVAADDKNKYRFYTVRGVYDQIESFENNVGLVFVIDEQERSFRKYHISLKP